jgi:hypothetical protein
MFEMTLQALHLVFGFVILAAGVGFSVRKYIFYKSSQKQLTDQFIISMNMLVLLGLIMVIYGLTIVLVNSTTSAVIIKAQDIFSSDGILRAVPEDIVLTIIILLFIINGIMYIILGRKELEREQVEISASIVTGTILILFAIIMIIVFSIGT